jgi:4-carboxymuconolactone decarboxylase
MDDVYRPLYSRGRGLAGEMLGPEWARRADEGGAPFGNELAEVITSLVYGGVWSRPGLSLRDRSLITVAVHVALQRPHEMKIHMPAALRNGVTREELEELLIQVGAYAGFPTAAAANGAAQEIFAQIDADAAAADADGDQ